VVFQRVKVGQPVVTYTRIQRRHRSWSP